MNDPPDDVATDDSPSAPGEESGPSTADDGDPDADDQPSVAAEAGIDESVVGTPRELASTVRLLWIVGSTIGALVAGAVLGGIAYVVGEQTALLPAGVETAVQMGGAVAALLVLVGVVRAVLLYRSWEYVVRADSLFLSRGVFTRVRTVVPYVRVQHIDTTRSPLERVLGLSTLVVYTAGSRGADVTIPGLTPERASTLQERLERLTTESEEEDAV
ncbi:PH domain-containing protein (plasmid) [Halolamina sp. CBA1230]|uniref:PH domain-containing protein n=1 Tax=Halolamina sp. CBA1230 TaxID=1853690 RepID=UPI0009A17D26|nr:PH domain-containing protein [Halolamina sp. CBA1230]